MSVQLASLSTAPLDIISEIVSYLSDLRDIEALFLTGALHKRFIQVQTISSTFGTLRPFFFPSSLLKYFSHLYCLSLKHEYKSALWPIKNVDLSTVPTSLKELHLGNLKTTSEFLSSVMSHLSQLEHFSLYKMEFDDFHSIGPLPPNLKSLVLRKVRTTSTGHSDSVLYHLPTNLEAVVCEKCEMSTFQSDPIPWPPHLTELQHTDRCTTLRIFEHLPASLLRLDLTLKFLSVGRFRSKQADAVPFFSYIPQSVTDLRLAVPDYVALNVSCPPPPTFSPDLKRLCIEIYSRGPDTVNLNIYDYWKRLQQPLEVWVARMDDPLSDGDLQRLIPSSLEHASTCTLIRTPLHRCQGTYGRFTWTSISARRTSIQTRLFLLFSPISRYIVIQRNSMFAPGPSHRTFALYGSLIARSETFRPLLRRHFCPLV